MKKIVYMILIVLIVLTYSSCFLASTYTVTYYPNGANSGSVPVDNKKYEAGEQYSILENTGDLVKEGFNFIGWNTKPDETGITYGANLTFQIIGSDIDLYAVWSDVDIYMCGGEYGYSACYWKNYERIILTDKTTYSAEAIFVNNNDVFIAGYKQSDDGSTRIPLYWKNGLEYILPFTAGTGSFAFSIVVDNSDNVYVAGSDGSSACYWLNGVQHILSDGYAKYIHIDENNVYIVGSDGSDACYWKNEIKTELTNGEATHIHIEDNNVYIFGLEWVDEIQSSGGVAPLYNVKYWKNGIESNYSISSRYGQEPKGTVDNNGDLYIVWTNSWMEGRTYIKQGLYWKNDELNYINESNGYSAIDIEIINNDRYILGSKILWINNIQIVYESAAYNDFFIQ